MSEAEMLQLSFLVNEAMMGVFSTFFAIVSAYVAGLYFFLHLSPAPIKLLAFSLLTAAFLFLGQTMAGIEVRGAGVITAWKTLPNPITQISDMSNLSVPLPLQMLMGDIEAASVTYDGFAVGALMGWLVAAGVYLALAYLTFLYKWPSAK